MDCIRDSTRYAVIASLLVILLPVRKAVDTEFFRADPEQGFALYKAACELADRYREERDAARRETVATKARLGEAVAPKETVADAIGDLLKRSALPNQAGAFLDAVAKSREKREAIDKAVAAKREAGIPDHSTHLPTY